MKTVCRRMDKTASPRPISVLFPKVHKNTQERLVTLTVVFADVEVPLEDKGLDWNGDKL